MMERSNMDNKFSVNWSLDERHLRVEDVEEEFYLIDIKFDSEMDKFNKKEKLEILGKLTNSQKTS